MKHFGEIEEIRKTPLKAGEKFGSGFVKFRYRSDAFNALCAKNLGTTANWAKQLFKHSKNSNNSVFVGQLNPEKVTGENFSNLFSTIGPIRTFKLIKSDKTRPAYGFVTFKNEGDAQKAISTLNGSRFHESKILVEENVSKCAVGKESKAVGTKEL